MGIDKIKENNQQYKNIMWKFQMGEKITVVV
jgi:hypothetical protein